MNKVVFISLIGYLFIKVINCAETASDSFLTSRFLTKSNSDPVKCVQNFVSQFPVDYTDFTIDSPIDENSYVLATIQNDATLLENLYTWCIDVNLMITPGTNYNESIAIDYISASTLAKYESLTDRPQRLNQLAFLLNNIFIGDNALQQQKMNGQSITDTCSTITSSDIQAAIWALIQSEGECDIPNSLCVESLNSVNVCNVAYIYNTVLKALPDGNTYLVPDTSCSGGNPIVPILVFPTGLDIKWDSAQVMLIAATFSSWDYTCTCPPTFQPTISPTFNPTNEPSFEPSSIPTIEPTFTPTTEPTVIPTFIPTKTPTFIPTAKPTNYPTDTPSLNPTAVPTTIPSVLPTNSPSSPPTTVPSGSPSLFPSFQPSNSPTTSPTFLPTQSPTALPSNIPTSPPTILPTSLPTVLPTSLPTTLPTQVPSFIPSCFPTATPSLLPSNSPTLFPSTLPTNSPVFTSSPSYAPSSSPSNPTYKPSASPTNPTYKPTSSPSTVPTANPSQFPTVKPTLSPSSAPTTKPTNQPSTLPTVNPTNLPTAIPTSYPTTSPTSQPTITDSCVHDFISNLPVVPASFSVSLSLKSSYVTSTITYSSVTYSNLLAWCADKDQEISGGVTYVSSTSYPYTYVIQNPSVATGIHRAVNLNQIAWIMNNLPVGSIASGSQIWQTNSSYTPTTYTGCGTITASDIQATFWAFVQPYGECDYTSFCTSTLSTVNYCNVAYIWNTAVANVPLGSTYTVPEASSSFPNPIVPICVVPDGNSQTKQVMLVQANIITFGFNYCSYPTYSPTFIPTTATPTALPTRYPTLSPSTLPTQYPTVSPTKNPTSSPTVNPTKNPTNTPTRTPTVGTNKLTQNKLKFHDFLTKTSTKDVNSIKKVNTKDIKSNIKINTKSNTKNSKNSTKK